MTDMEELRAIVVQLGRGLARTEAGLTRTEAGLTRTEAGLARTEAGLARTEAGLARTEARLARLEKNMEKSNMDFDKKMVELWAYSKELSTDFHQGLKEMRDDFNNRYGIISDRLGNITELVVIPGVNSALSKLGHNFDHIYPNKIVKRPNGNMAFEIDLFLANGKEAMAVEIKTRLATGMIDRHMSRLEKMREFEKSVNIRNKKLYGAVAGVIIDDDAQKYALKNGLYVLEIIEDKNRLRAKAPTVGKVRTW